METVVVRPAGVSRCGHLAPVGSDLVRVLFPQLSSVLIDEVIEQGSVLLIHARTQSTVVASPHCGQPAERVHAYHLRRLADVPAAGRGMVVELRVRRLVCQTAGCGRRTFREQVPALAQRWVRRTRQLTALIADLAVVLAGRAGAPPARRGTRRAGDPASWPMNPI